MKTTKAELIARLEQNAHDFKQLRDALDCDGSDLPQLLAAIERLKAHAPIELDAPTVEKIITDQIARRRLILEDLECMAEELERRLKCTLSSLAKKSLS